MANYTPTLAPADVDGELDDTYHWVVVFQDAVSEMDAETQEAIRLLRRAIELHWERYPSPKAAPRTEGARKWQAWQVVARLVWNKRGINFDDSIVQAVKG
jgi:hypothetical protein